MFQNTEMLTEAKKAKFQPKLYLLLPIVIVYFFIFYIMPQTVLGNIFARFPVSDTVDELSFLFLNIITTLASILYCTKIEKRSLASMGFIKTGIGKRYIIGAFVGALMMLLLVGGCALFDAVEIELGSITPVAILFFLGYVVQAMSEEVALRGFFMGSATNRVPIPAAILISSLFFALPNYYFSGRQFLYSINTPLAGVLLSTYILRTGHIWGACGFHTGINFFGRCIFGGIGNNNTLFFVSGNIPGKELIGSNDYGISSGIMMTLLTVVFTLALFFIASKTRKECVNSAKIG